MIPVKQTENKSELSASRLSVSRVIWFETFCAAAITGQSDRAELMRLVMMAPQRTRAAPSKRRLDVEKDSASFDATLRIATAIIER